MKRFISLLLISAFFCCCFGCTAERVDADVLATTAPVYEFTQRLCSGTNLSVDCLISEDISCLHDYTLQPKQMRAIESASIVIMSGAGLEESFGDLLSSTKISVDASAGIQLFCAEESHNNGNHDHAHHHTHDPHIWLSPENAMIMTANIFTALCAYYPQYTEVFISNRDALLLELGELRAYAETSLSNIQNRKIITFHDGFSYMAEAFDLEILHAIEEESGREASASELIDLCTLVETNRLTCIFVERNGSASAAQIIANETGAKLYQLDMAMSGIGYFNAMYNNINTLKEALG